MNKSGCFYVVFPQILISTAQNSSAQTSPDNPMCRNTSKSLIYEPSDLSEASDFFSSWSCRFRYSINPFQICSSFVSVPKMQYLTKRCTARIQYVRTKFESAHKISTVLNIICVYYSTEKLEPIQNKNKFGTN